MFIESKLPWFETLEQELFSFALLASVWTQNAKDVIDTIVFHTSSTKVLHKGNSSRVCVDESSACYVDAADQGCVADLCNCKLVERACKSRAPSRDDESPAKSVNVTTLWSR